MGVNYNKNQTQIFDTAYLDMGTFTKIGAIGIVASALFFMILCQKLY